MSYNLTSILHDIAPRQFTRVKMSAGSVDGWDFSSPVTCQRMLDNLVDWVPGAVKPTGLQMFQQLAAAHSRREEADLNAEKGLGIAAEARNRIKEAAPGLANPHAIEMLTELLPVIPDWSAGSPALQQAVSILQAQAAAKAALAGMTVAEKKAFNPKTDW